MSNIVTKQQMEALDKRMDQLRRDLKTAQNTKELLQQMCEHPDWKYIGHDSHKSYEKCVVCGFQREC